MRGSIGLGMGIRGIILGGRFKGLVGCWVVVVVSFFHFFL